MYKIKRSNGKFAVVEDGDSEFVKEFTSRELAEKYMQSLAADQNIKSVIKKMGEMGAMEYAHAECWDIQSASAILSQISELCARELEEPKDVEILCDIMYSLIEFIRGEIDEMEACAKEAAVQTQHEKSAGIEISSMNMNYIKSIGSKLESPAVKYIARDQIKGYTFLWGSPSLTDVEVEYFTKDTDFWDSSLGKSPRPLAWNHAQDESFKSHPVVGLITDWGDDDLGRWFIAKMDRAHRYRKVIDALIERGVLGTSSDSAPQYVERVKTGKATWLKTWAWFASSLTDTPAEPRMIGSLEFLKSLYIMLPEARNAWEWNIKRIKLAKLKK